MSRRRHFTASAGVLLVLMAVSPVSGQQSPPVTAVGNIGSDVGVGLGAPGGPGGPGSQPTSAGNAGASSNGNTGVIPTASGGGGSSSGGSSGGSSGPPLTWVRTYPNVGSLGGEQAVSAGAFCLDDAGNRGVSYVDNLTNTQTGEVVSTRSGCATSATPAPNAQSNGSTTAAQPPPTPAEIWARTPIATPTFGVNPDQGLTGLATWLWDPNGGAAVNATVQLRGYSAQASATPVRWEWTMGGRPGDTESRQNPPYRVVSTQPGRAWAPGGRGGPPAATYMYETKGDYTLTLTVTWTGSYTYTDPAGAVQSVDLGTTTRTATRNYQVAELRPVLTATGP